MASSYSEGEETVSDNGARANGNPIGSGDFAEKDSSLVLDEELTSAAAPFLYLLSILVIVVAAYLIYTFLHA